MVEQEEEEEPERKRESVFFFPFGFEWREREKEGKKGSKPAARRACVFRNQRKCYSRASDNLELRQAGNNARRRNKTTEKKPILYT